MTHQKSSNDLYVTGRAGAFQLIFSPTNISRYLVVKDLDNSQAYHLLQEGVEYCPIVKPQHKTLFRDDCKIKVTSL